MEISLEWQDRIDQYLRNELGEEDNIQFEAEMKEHAALRLAVEEQKSMIEELSFNRDLNHFKNLAKDLQFQPEETIIQPIRWLPRLAVAAAVIVILCVLAFLFFSGPSADQLYAENFNPRFSSSEELLTVLVDNISLEDRRDRALSDHAISLEAYLVDSLSVDTSLIDLIVDSRSLEKEGNYTEAAQQLGLALALSADKKGYELFMEDVAFQQALLLAQGGKEEEAIPIFNKLSTSQQQEQSKTELAQFFEGLMYLKTEGKSSIKAKEILDRISLDPAHVKHTAATEILKRL